MLICPLVRVICLLQKEQDQNATLCIPKKLIFSIHFEHKESINALWSKFHDSVIEQFSKQQKCALVQSRYQSKHIYSELNGLYSL